MCILFIFHWFWLIECIVITWQYVWMFLFFSECSFFNLNETDILLRNQAGFYHLLPFMEYKFIKLCGIVLQVWAKIS